MAKRVLFSNFDQWLKQVKRSGHVLREPKNPKRGGWIVFDKNNMGGTHLGGWIRDTDFNCGWLSAKISSKTA